MKDFVLSDSFLAQYKGKQPDFGPLGLIVYKRSYARPIYAENRTEEFWETLRRVVEGCYSIQKQHCKSLRLPWNDHKGQSSAQEMFSLMWEMKFLPPGRGLWAMGSAYIEERKTSAPLFNCSFHGSKDINIDFAEPFCFTMDMSMLGVGGGGDTEGAGKVKIRKPYQGDYSLVVEDSREGWVNLIRILLDTYVGKGSLPASIDYSKVRPAGTLIKTFGGVSGGPDPLIQLVKDIHSILQPLIGRYITSAAIIDLYNAIGRCVVSGNLRRTALIMLGHADDMAFLDLKNPNINQERLNKWGWTCVSGDTLVNTSIGSLPINNLLTQARTFKAVVDGKEYSIGGVKCTGFKSVLFIETISGQSIKTTPDHLLMTKLGWKRADQLTGKDSLRISDNTNIEIDKKTSDYKQGYLIGHLIGDGTFVSTSTTGSDIARIQIYEKDSGHKSMKDYIESIFKFKTRTDFNGFSGPYLNKRTNNNWWFLSCKKFTELAASYGVKRGNKFITPEIEAGSTDFVAGIASGLFDTDGWVIKDKRILAIEQVHKESLVILQRILLRLGINSRLIKARQPEQREILKGKFVNCKQVYRLKLAGYFEAKKFVEKCGIHHSAKLQTWNNLKPNKFIRSQKYFAIKSVTVMEPELVYDMLVPNIHAFSANGFYIHNSNNTIKATIGMDYSIPAEMTAINGEPGYWWQENAQRYGRMIDPPNNLDEQADGTNACGEITLYSAEMCNVPETFPARHETLEEYKRTLKYAYLYGKTVSLLSTHNEKTNAIQLRNRRLGISQSGIAQAIAKRGIREHCRWCDEGYKYLKQLDKIYSHWLCVPESIKLTAVKPSGSISTLPNATPGIHYPFAEYYLRAIRIAKGSSFAATLQKAGYTVEDDLVDPSSVVVYFPIKEKDFERARKDLSLWEQLELAAQMQAYWADNQVSVTVTFKPEEAKDIERALELYGPRLKSVSFLPLENHGFKQAPYQQIIKERYEELVANLKPFSFDTAETQGDEKTYCDSDRCEIIRNK